MNPLEMKQAVAKLEGINAFVYKEDHLLYENDQGYMFENGVTCDWYDPFTNSALNCALRDKYEVAITYHHKQVAIWIESTWITVNYANPQGVNCAVVKCILKANNLWQG